MGFSVASEQSDRKLVPVLPGQTWAQAKTGKRIVQVISTSSTAATLTIATAINTAVNSGGTDNENLNGKFWISLRCISTDCYFAFRKATAAASVTTSTGQYLPAGGGEEFWVDINETGVIEVITSTGTGKLQVIISSDETEKTAGGF